ncbi:MAG: GDP-L-fucose synthase family protein [Aminipila sp.]
MNKNSVVYIAGGNGVAGSAIARALEERGFKKVLKPSHKQLDLTNPQQVDEYFNTHQPEYVFFVAAKMGSIVYRKEHPADILMQNLQMQTNIIGAAHKYHVRKLLFMSSDFIYPNTESGILSESDFLTDAPAEKDLPYSLAKITGVKLCDFYREQYGDNFFTVVPCAFFGENSSFDLQRASVVAALIKRFSDAKDGGAKELVLWGSGKPVKEFLHSDDIASACNFLMEHYEEGGIINIGSGDGGHTIMETAEIISEVVGFNGEINCDLSKPDGIMRRVMNSSRIRELGWTPQYDLRTAINKMYAYFSDCENHISK